MGWATLSAYAAWFGASLALECTPSAIQSILPSNASVNFAYLVPANSTFHVPKGDTGYPDSPVGLPSLCAASVQVKSIGNSTFGFGLFLPEAWNNRFLAVGNGGFAGGINWLDMATGSRYGFVAMSTDTGHNSSSGDGSWAYNQPEKVENWGHLGMHGSVQVAKTIVSAYYSRPPSFSYYSGCSTGGRQGLKEAERYPEDFDGIIAGAPAWWTSHLQPWTVKVGLYNLPVTDDHHIPPTLFPTIAREVLKQCDPQDGLVDSIISDPVRCKFHTEELLCGSNSPNKTQSNCLTRPQLSTLSRIYNESWSDDGVFDFPGLFLGTEAQWLLLSSTEPNPLGTDYVRYFLGLGQNWSFYDFNDKLQRMADLKDPGNATVGFDLSAFRSKGGKIITYHGLSDGLIPAGSTFHYYNQVQNRLHPRGGDMGDFLRFFPVPGMGHCSWTPPLMDAPWYFAGPNQSPNLGSTVYGVPGFEDREHDILLAMMAWVEQGVAPDRIVATKYVNDTLHSKVLRQRPLCMYPNQATYSGKGDANLASSWECSSQD